MTDEIYTNFKSVFDTLLANQKIMFPSPRIIKVWEVMLNAWVKDDSCPLYVRKGGIDRGTPISPHLQRQIISTDNSPAHWVFKTMVMDNRKISFKELKELVTTQQIPIAFIRKKSESNLLTKEMVATKDTRLNEQGWKLAHINGIAMKRGNNVTLDHYKMHHTSFLSLNNMYLIDKSFSGLAEVDLFNQIVAAAKRELYQ